MQTLTFVHIKLRGVPMKELDMKMSTHCSNHNAQRKAHSKQRRIHKYMKSENSYDKREEQFVG